MIYSIGMILQSPETKRIRIITWRSPTSNYEGSYNYELSNLFNIIRSDDEWLHYNCYKLYVPNSRLIEEMYGNSK